MQNGGGEAEGDWYGAGRMRSSGLVLVLVPLAIGCWPLSTEAPGPTDAGGVDAGSPRQCSSTPDCREGEFCSTINRVCQPTRCSSESECSYPYACNVERQECELVTDCASSDDCAAGEDCWLGLDRGDLAAPCGSFCQAPQADNEVCYVSSDQGGACLLREDEQYLAPCLPGRECVDTGESPYFPVWRCLAPQGVGAECFTTSGVNDGCEAGLVCRLDAWNQSSDTWFGACASPMSLGDVCRFGDHPATTDDWLWHPCDDGLVCEEEPSDGGPPTSRCVPT